ncbi:unnamed protein product [Rhizophagus irregularis]|nr:unnamed protein product [Rhizophagus irregularis]
MDFLSNSCSIAITNSFNKSVKLPVFSTYCAKGKVILPFLQELPSPLNILLTRTDLRSCTFRQNIRMYNSALSFTSIGAKINQQITGTSGIYTFRIHRKMYHRIGSLLPNSETHGELQQMLHDINPYINQFCQAGN